MRREEIFEICFEARQYGGQYHEACYASRFIVASGRLGALIIAGLASRLQLEVYAG